VLFLSCKANSRVKLAKTGHGPNSTRLFVICVVRLLFVLFCVLFVCKRVLPPGDNPIAVNKYIISYPAMLFRKTGSIRWEATSHCSSIRYATVTVTSTDTQQTDRQTDRSVLVRINTLNIWFSVEQ
jgi:hypothetical protein